MAAGEIMKNEDYWEKMKKGIGKENLTIKKTG